MMVQMTQSDKLKAFEQSLESVREGERPVIEIEGQRVAVISAEDLAYFEALEDAEDVRLAREAMAEPGPTVSWKELKSELGL